MLFTFDPIDYSEFDDIPNKSRKVKPAKTDNFLIDIGTDRSSYCLIEKNDSKIVIKYILDFILKDSGTNLKNEEYSAFLKFCNHYGYSLNYEDDDFFYKI